MYIKNIIQMLNEYNSSKTNTTLAGMGGKKASGKNYDNIIAGKTKPYKQTEYETKYAKLFPFLGELVKKLKSQSIKGDIIINGPALIDLQKLLTTFKPRITPSGDYTLPFGDNIRVKQRGNVMFLGFNEPNSLKSSPTNLTQGVPAIDITK